MIFPKYTHTLNMQPAFFTKQQIVTNLRVWTIILHLFFLFLYVFVMYRDMVFPEWHQSIDAVVCNLLFFCPFFFLILASSSFCSSPSPHHHSQRQFLISHGSRGKVDFHVQFASFISILELKSTSKVHWVCPSQAEQSHMRSLIL